MMAASALGQAPATPSYADMQRPFGQADYGLFAAPPKVHYPQTWFHFIGGNVSHEGITADLEAIAAAGISGVQLFHGQFGGRWPATGDPIECLSPRWDAAVRHTADECRRLGLRFTMQNCQGWAMAGGPWIKPENAMRGIAYSRTYVDGGARDVRLAVPEPSSDPWRDYRDVAVLAFPVPEGDDGVRHVPSQVTGSGDVNWFDLMAGRVDRVSLPAAEHWFEAAFHDTVTVRTVVLPSVESLEHAWCYVPDVKVTVEAVMPDGAVKPMADVELPPSNWQDGWPMSIACNEVKGCNRIRVTVRNGHNINLGRVAFLSAGRKNNWESEAAHTLRGIERTGDSAVRSADCYVKLSDIRDVSAAMTPDGRFDAGVLSPGRWTVLRIGHVNAGRRNGPAPAEGTGWECDKLSTAGAAAHFAGYIGRLTDGPLADGMLDGLLLDSWECGTQTWTDRMEQEFDSIAGYPLRRMLPAVLGYVVEDAGMTARFLTDWRRVIGELFATRFYRTISSLAHERGLSVAYETAAGDVFPADIMEYFKYADVPMCEYWQPFSESYVGSINFKPVKPTASAAHVYGKPRVDAEAFTSFSLTWDEHWDRLKEVADFNAIEGVTHNVFHTYTHNPQVGYLQPGTSFGAGIGTPFLRGQTWWRHMPAFTSYLARCSYMLERGKPVSDVLWYLGDEINHKPDQEYAFPQGYRYDYCNSDVLLNRLSVEDSCIVTPEGLRYRMLWMPDNKRMLVETLEKLLELVRGGAVIVGNAPEDMATLTGGEAAKARFDALVAELWGGKYGRQVLAKTSIDDALGLLGIPPDVTGADVRWLHRAADGADWYMVCPPKEQAFCGDVSFRASGKPSLWNPVDGTVTALESTESDGYTTVSLDMPRTGSCFVVFDRSGNAPRFRKPAMNGREIVLDKDWAVSFPDGWGAPASMDLDSLKAWKDMDITPEGRAFSGTATYSTSFKMDKAKKGQPVMLDLGMADMIAVVKVNGKEVGTLWCAPYRLDISSAAKKGDNELTVEVTGTWHNRLAYDAGQPEAERKTWTINGPSAESPLSPSGLLGPVTIKY